MKNVQTEDLHENDCADTEKGSGVEFFKGRPMGDGNDTGHQKEKTLIIDQWSMEQRYKVTHPVLFKLSFSLSCNQSRSLKYFRSNA